MSHVMCLEKKKKPPLKLEINWNPEKEWKQNCPSFWEFCKVTKTEYMIWIKFVDFLKFESVFMNFTRFALFVSFFYTRNSDF